MANINKDEIKALLVPKPPRPVQEAMVKALDGHWRAYQSRMAEVRELLSRGDDEIAQRLGLRPPEFEPVAAYGARRSALHAGARLNAEFFHPERTLAIRAIEDGETPA